ncbi:phage tail sheath family protein [Archangium violaceum]|uniref:phage tail sheath family protein n=1 Tax=Archangium violaceum TaxID=83451 RepID=UPI00193C2D59|nr:phage tail sheath subtilisin-like domain-containing protein [Archangium violaceum]QRK06094.1 phage tail sheath family protein [Archangium violaceum]
MALVRPPLSAPGIYVQEVPSGVRTIVGVSTSLTVFFGRAERGPVGQPIEVSSFSEYQHTFGGLLDDSPMPYSVQDFFLNGGGQAIIIRLFENRLSSPLSPPFSGTFDEDTALISPDPANVPSSPPVPALSLLASSPGAWGKSLTYFTDTKNITQTARDRFKKDGKGGWDASDLFNLTISYARPDGTKDLESFAAVSTDPRSGPRYLKMVLEQTSSYARLVDTGSSPINSPPVDTHNGDVQDSGKLSEGTYLAALDQLDRLDIYNIVCIPSDSFLGSHDITPNVYAAAAGKCRDEKATLVLDPPSNWTDPTRDIHPDSFGTVFGYGPASDLAPYSALYFPRVQSEDPLNSDAIITRPACGIIAGIMARTDATRGVWKAPAGQETGLNGITGLNYKLTDTENGNLNQVGVNCLRSFPVVGPVVWGARTLAGADVLSSDFKYLPVRRLTDFIEQTLLRQTRFAVFEPNDEPLWSQLRLAIGAFMNDLFRQGAFQGSSRDKAFFVKCDATTTTQDDIDKGIVNIEVGFAPLKPAEFVVIYIEQSAGQTA